MEKSSKDELLYQSGKEGREGEEEEPCQPAEARAPLQAQEVKERQRSSVFKNPLKHGQEEREAGYYKIRA